MALTLDQIAISAQAIITIAPGQTVTPHLVLFGTVPLDLSMPEYRALPADTAIDGDLVLAVGVEAIVTDAKASPARALARTCRKLPDDAADEAMLIWPDGLPEDVKAKCLHVLVGRNLVRAATSTLGALS